MNKKAVSRICIALAAVLLSVPIACSPGSDRAPDESATAETEEAAMLVELRGQQVEASCGQCQFGLTGGGCDLAIRHEGIAYYVDGTNIDDHGDAHADDGFCNAVRMATVSGRVEDDKFMATAFQLVEKP